MLSIKYINEPVVEILPEMPYVGIAVQATLLEWGKANRLGDELYDWLLKMKIKPAGPLFYRYWIIGDEEEAVHAEVGVPVEQVIAGNDRIISSFIPGGSYVTALHQGHLGHLAKSLNEVEIWAKKEGLELDKRWEGDIEIWNGRFESCLTDSKQEPDSDKWEIKISFLLLRDDAA